MKTFSPWLWVAFAAIFGLKFALVSELSMHIVFAPHDDSLYLVRAMHLLNDGSLGPYDARVLAKLPGLSIWLAGLSALGLPYLITMNFLYAGVGLYVILALRRCGMHGLVLLAIWALYLLNPVTMSQDWLRILREPLSTTLLVGLLGAALHIFVCIRDGRRYWPHLLVFSGVLAFSMVVREEDKLLWGLLALFVAAVFFDGLARGRKTRWNVRLVAPLLIVPVLVALVSDITLRQAVETRYGLPILHDYGEGEFPKLLAAIRSIDSKKDNRLVMVTQEALDRLRTVTPEFAPVIDRLPPPGPSSYSCQLQGVCTEWSNGWMPFWIKDAAFSAGLTPDLITAQKYFKGVREHIEEACRTGSLKCTPRGAGLLPPLELRWTRAVTMEFMRSLGLLYNPLGGLAFAPTVDSNLLRIAQLVTMEVPEARVPMGADAVLAKPDTDAFAQWRSMLRNPLLVVAAILMTFSVPALFYCWASEQVHPPSVLLWIATVFFAYSALRLLALAYVATFLGPFDAAPRVIFSTYTAALIFCPAIIAEALRLRMLAVRGRKGIDRKG